MRHERFLGLGPAMQFSSPDSERSFPFSLDRRAVVWTTNFPSSHLGMFATPKKQVPRTGLSASYPATPESRLAATGLPPATDLDASGKSARPRFSARTAVGPSPAKFRPGEDGLAGVSEARHFAGDRHDHCVPAQSPRVSQQAHKPILRAAGVGSPFPTPSGGISLPSGDNGMLCTGIDRDGGSSLSVLQRPRSQRVGTPLGPASPLGVAPQRAPIGLAELSSSRRNVSLARSLSAATASAARGAGALLISATPRSGGVSGLFAPLPPLHAAVAAGDLSRVETLLLLPGGAGGVGGGVNHHDFAGRTPLHIACMLCNLSVAR